MSGGGDGHGNGPSLPIQLIPNVPRESNMEFTMYIWRCNAAHCSVLFSVAAIRFSNEDILRAHHIQKSSGGSVSIVTRPRAERPGFDFRQWHRVQTVSGPYPAFYTVRTKDSIPRG